NLNGGADWRPIGRSLVLALNRQWPGKVRFRDAGGQLVSEREALAGNVQSVQAGKELNGSNVRP
ncbi:MAG TPA: hypothetical protein VGH15_07870, partial [Caulobacteraceae bacterium]